ncbi:MAG: phosphoribosyl-ATP diphosphatase [Gammaproteobacteria bacterium]|nr:MAG: phosphoribosyl-ATP diphosphatase [Gammaproteobacteria bacterium]|tara:strand:- start:65 stop:442 length:378 start_codon:yes stop_codon:yes gene_type:complete
MSYQNDVEIFMNSGSQPVQKELSMDNDEAKLYMKLISEEYNETLDAFKKSDLVELADGLADMVWVIMGMCNSCGIQFDNVWKEVRASNMSKFVDGKAIKNEYGKIMKPKTYFKPNIKNALGLEKT